MFNKIRSFHTPKSPLVTESELTEAPFFGSVPYDIGSDKNEVQIDKKIGGIPTAFQWIEILLRPQNANICTLGT